MPDEGVGFQLRGTQGRFLTRGVTSEINIKLDESGIVNV